MCVDICAIFWLNIDWRCWAALNLGVPMKHGFPRARMKEKSNRGNKDSSRFSKGMSNPEGEERLPTT